MTRYTVSHIFGVALHFPHRFAVTSTQGNVGEIGRAQTPAKAERLRLALEVLESYERGELIERALIDHGALAAASD
ncbi:hypothetical protein [Deinococcus ruber]|uniref:Uncharacterized protein n=1 Tax=Deinococcus ruber TaxID=1848197 RepID=A0A918BX32_9DEIO|nr:hypothetical protein [Deinococcus ruber]GGQ97110.1 hypothetical protein GCM10008957_06810 [Deinococcus ruber]